jgi:hypothetical protein
LINQEVGDVKVVGKRNLSFFEIVGEVEFSKLLSEFSVEGTTVGDEGAGLGNVTNKALLGSLELVGGLDPSDLVVSERVDKLVGLVHLSLGLQGLVHEGITSSDLRIELSLKFGLKTIDLSEFSLSGSQFLFGFSELSGTDLEEPKLGLHNLGGLVIIRHGTSPCAETFEGSRGLLGDGTGEEVFTLGSL